jgi:hypothetical protein
MINMASSSSCRIFRGASHSVGDSSMKDDHVHELSSEAASSHHEHGPARPKPNPLSFPKSSEPFSLDLFRSPSAEYRGCPLWAWNSKLPDKEHLERQMECFRDMGFGGFYMHSRVGLDTEYLGKKFMDTVEKCVDWAESNGMLPCL